MKKYLMIQDNQSAKTKPEPQDVNHCFFLKFIEKTIFLIKMEMKHINSNFQKEGCSIKLTFLTNRLFINFFD